MKCNFMFVVNKRHHSLKITITFHHRFEFAIWEMVSTRLHEKPWKPHRFWVNLSGRRANWIGFSYLSTSILCTTQIFQVHCTLAQLPTVPNTFIRCLMPRMYIKRNVTWTNKSSCRRWVEEALQRKKSHAVVEIRQKWLTWTLWKHLVECKN